MSDLNFTDFRKAYLDVATPELPGFANNFTLFTSEDIIKRLFVVSDKLIDNAKKFNLTSILELQEIIRKHLIDSLIPLGLLLDENLPVLSILDVGTGAGFPLLPWSCALADEKISLTGLDATAKKIAHINETSAAVGLTNLSAIQGRAEEVAASSSRESFTLVTARAVAELPILIELCAAFVTPGGHFAALKGKADDEIHASMTAAKLLGLDMVKSIVYELPGGDSRALVLYRKMRPTPRKYPRRYAEIVKKPL